MIPAIPKKYPTTSIYLISRTAQSTARAVNAMYVNDGFCVEVEVMQVKAFLYTKISKQGNDGN
jgi:hypothetical protein